MFCWRRQAGVSFEGGDTSQGAGRRGLGELPATQFISFLNRGLASVTLCEHYGSRGGRGVLVWGVGSSRLPEDLPPGLSPASCPAPEGALGNGGGGESGRPLSLHWSGSSWLGPMRALTLGGEACAFIWSDCHLLPPLCQSHLLPSRPSFRSLFWLCHSGRSPSGHQDLVLI